MVPLMNIQFNSNTLSLYLFLARPIEISKPSLDYITWIARFGTPYKILLNRPHTHKSSEKGHASRLVVCTACPATSKRLLPYHGSGTLTVDIEVASRIAQL